MSKLSNEEKRQRGIELSPIKHTMKRRAPWHDYAKVGTYMITLVTEGRRPLFGRLEYKPVPEARATVAGPEARATVAGPEARATVAGPEARATVAGPEARAEGASPLPPVPPAVKTRLFEPGYNDRILLDDGQLDRWKHYLDDNPRRLALKRLHPDLFTIRHGRRIGEWSCQMVGNIFLLDIPDKVAVIYHRRYTDSEYQRLIAQWLACGERGGVLVSAAIHPNERAVINEAKSLGYRVITLQENGFPHLYKPTGEDFDACTSGLLLQISPWEHHNIQQTISRSQCLELNRLAEEIAK